MRQLENKETTIENGDKKLTYFDLAKTCVNVPPQAGFDVQEMNKRLRVIEKLEGEKAEFEDADFETLKQCVMEMKWGILSREVSDFVKYIQEETEEK